MLGRKPNVGACPALSRLRSGAQPTRICLDQRTFRCVAGRRWCNAWSGAPVNHVSVLTDIVFLVVLWRLRQPLSLASPGRDVPRRGSVSSPETVRFCKALVAPLLTKHLGEGVAAWPVSRGTRMKRA